MYIYIAICFINQQDQWSLPIWGLATYVSFAAKNHMIPEIEISILIRESTQCLSIE